MIIDFGVQRQRREGMKGYEGCYDCEYETQEEGAGEHSKKIANRVEKGEAVEGVSCTHVAVGGDGTTRKMIPYTQNKGSTHVRKSGIITTEVNMCVTVTGTLKQQHYLWL